MKKKCLKILNLWWENSKYKLGKKIPLLEDPQNAAHFHCVLGFLIGYPYQ